MWYLYGWFGFFFLALIDFGGSAIYHRAKLKSPRPTTMHKINHKKYVVLRNTTTFRLTGR